jgi:hypothetical protein
MNGKRQVSKKLILAAAVGLVALVPMSAMAANKLIVNGTDGVTPKFVVTDTGYVGSGTSAPSRAITAIGSGTDLSSSQIISIHNAPSAPSGTALKMGGGYIGYFNYPGFGLPQQGDRLGYFLFGAFDTDGITTRNGAGLGGYAESSWISGNPGPASFPSYLTFETAGASGSRAERVRITGSGNVGIGTSSPSQQLEVNGGVRLNTAISPPACNAASRGTFWFIQSASGADIVQVCANDNTGTPVWRSVSLN